MSESSAPHPLDEFPGEAGAGRRAASQLDYTAAPDRWQTVGRGLRSIAIAQIVLLSTGLIVVGLSALQYAWSASQETSNQYGYGSGSGYGSSYSSRPFEMASALSCGILALLITAAPVVLGFLIRGLVLCLIGAQTRDLRKLLVIATVFLGLGCLTMTANVGMLVIDMPEWFLGLIGAAFLCWTVAQVTYLVFLGKVQRAKVLTSTAIALCLLALVALVVGQNMVYGQVMLSREEFSNQLMLVAVAAGIMTLIELTCACVSAFVVATQIQGQVAGYQQTQSPAELRQADLRRYF